MNDPNLAKLAKLVDAFAVAQEAFLTEYARDDASEACHAAYDRQEDALEALKDELETVLRYAPQILSAALRR